jgi:hypothetical protein
VPVHENRAEEVYKESQKSNNFSAMSTFYIEKDDEGGYVMFRDSMQRKNAIAFGKGGVLGKFVEMMTGSLDLQKDGETIVIKAEKAETQESQKPNNILT